MLQLEDDRFRSHPSFVLAVCNMYLRWQCVKIGSIVAQREAKDLTVEELQNKVLVDNDLEVLSKLNYYGKSIVTHPAYWKSQNTETLCFNEHIRFASQEKRMMNLFQVSWVFLKFLMQILHKKTILMSGAQF